MHCKLKSSTGSGDGGESSDWLGGGSGVMCEGDNEKVAGRGRQKRLGGKQDGVIGREQLHVRSYSAYTNESVDTVPPVCHREYYFPSE